MKIHLIKFSTLDNAITWCGISSDTCSEEFFGGDYTTIEVHKVTCKKCRLSQRVDFYNFCKRMHEMDKKGYEDTFITTITQQI